MLSNTAALLAFLFSHSESRLPLRYIGIRCNLFWNIATF